MPALPRRYSLYTGLSFVMIATLLAGCSDEPQNDGGGGNGGQGAPAPEVRVERAELTSVKVNQDYAGRARGAREVEVRARIQGILEERQYSEGQVVEEGDSLFRIDPDPARAAVRGAEAQRQVAQANLSQADREWNRIASLFQRNAVSERERDSAQSALDLAQANLAVAEAGLIQARLELGYTDVKAPVSGVTSLEDLPEGSLVQQGTLLTTIIQQDPIHVRFALPEDDAAIQRQARLAMSGSDEPSNLPATLVMVNGEEYSEGGEVDFTASILDPRTGSVSARAVFPNPDYEIVPGQFVRVRIQLQNLEDVFTVKETSVGQGPDGARVFVVDDSSKVSSRAVELGPVVGGRQVVLSGLEEGDRVVTSGMVSLRDGMDVKVADPENGEPE